METYTQTSTRWHSSSQVLPSQPCPEGCSSILYANLQKSRISLDLLTFFIYFFFKQSAPRIPFPFTPRRRALHCWSVFGFLKKQRTQGLGLTLCRLAFTPLLYSLPLSRAEECGRTCCSDGTRDSPPTRFRSPRRPPLQPPANIEPSLAL